ncbi:lambda exonuclease family protein [Stenotrophomonas maltophilia group sp. RY12688]|uniref:lambda exonuclease family protein n=1 Tax=Stenotrophomonas maltophilia group sp. RY12688 TaxID=3454438 RepID=UPI003F9E5527
MIDQRSDEWFAARAGRITASRMNDVMVERERGEFKSGPRKGQQKPQPKALTDYAHQLAAERLTLRPRKQVKAAALAWGQTVEPAAVAAYQAETGVIVTPAEFILHPKYDFIGASPDFLVGDDGGGEIKSPESSEVHLETLLTGLPPEHIEQIQGGLWVTGRQWWDFVSFHPDFPESHRIYIQRVPRDDEYIERLESACLQMEADVQAILAQLNRSAA